MQLQVSPEAGQNLQDLKDNEEQTENILLSK